MSECSEGEQKHVYDYQNHEYPDEPDLVAIIRDPEYDLQGSLVGITLYPEGGRIEDQK